MTRLTSMPIRKQFLILIVSMMIAPILLTLYSAYDQRKDDIQNAQFLAERLASQISKDQQIMLSGAEQLLSTLAHIKPVQKRQADQVRNLLAELIRINPQYSNILIMDNKGLLWASAVPVTGIVSYADRRYFKDVMDTGNFSSGEFSISRTINKPVMNFSYPIKDAAGNITDVAVVAFTPDKYAQQFKTGGLPENTSLLLTDHNGTILYNLTDPTLIGKQDREDLFRRMSEGGNEGTFEGVSNIGIPRYFAYRKLRLPNERTPYMYIRTGIAVDSVVDKANRQIIVNTGIMSAIMLLFLAVAVYIIKRGIIEKIDELRIATQKMALGNLDLRVSDKVSGGELGELGKAFESMARRLSEEMAEVTHNIAERQKSEAALCRLNDELEQRVEERTNELKALNRELESFSYSVSHDLRAPLLRITGFADIIMEECGPKLLEREIHYIARLKAACTRMNELVDALLKLSRVNSQELSPELVDLSSLARETFESLQELDANRRVTFTAMPGISVCADPALLKSVMENLVGNALKYSAKKDQAVVEFGSTHHDGETVYFIRDNGAGFDMAYADDLFAPFRRLHSDEEFVGIGIGLATVQRIIRRHGGRIWAEGKTGEGATFYFTLG